MSDRRHGTGTSRSPGDGQVPVMGTPRCRERARASAHGEPGTEASAASRRDAALRMLMEAYRRDAGPGSLDPV